MAMREPEIGAATARAAKAAGVKHYVWSTLPDAHEMSGGALHVHHFTGKAKVDAAVAAAGFEHHTFVDAPMYFQNFQTMMAPQPLPDGTKGWAVPMDPARRCIHAGDVRDVGRVVARVFENPEKVGSGEYVGVAPGVTSWDEMVETLNEQGHDLVVRQVPAEVYDGFYEGAQEMREMFQWFEGYTYFGPHAETKLANLRAIHPEPLTSFRDWAAENLPAR